MTVAQPVREAWAVGLACSALCLALQLLLLAFRPELRRLDQKILIQLTVARLLYTLLEYVIVANHYPIIDGMENIVWGVIYYMDAVAMCMMYVFSKSLRDQALSPLVLVKWKFSILSFNIWMCVAVVVGLLRSVFIVYPKYIIILKIILTLKIIFLSYIVFANVIIVYANIKVGISDRSIANHAKKCIISLILICVMDIEAIVTAYWAVSESAMSVFSLINAFQAVAITLMFVIPAEAPLHNLCVPAQPDNAKCNRSDGI